tara:strand:- start:292 stop:1254 length:963 start_codon:yes stop_codon:yes gene_type:complete
MDILTLGKMNQMAKDVNVTLEYLANSTYSALKDVCDFQAGNMSALNTAAQAALDEIANAGGGGSGVFSNVYFNTNAKGCHCFTGCSTSWTVPDGTKTITFEAWGGGGAGAGHCCQGCWCDIASCASSGGFYSKKTICADNSDFSNGDVYTICMGDGGNANNGSGCWTGCCDAPRGCASYVTGNGLSNFCAVGGRGGYNIYCTCRCNASHCFQEHPGCHGMVQGGNVDETYGSKGNEWFKERHNCDCGSRYTRTGDSHMLSNSIHQYIEDSMSWCGCETPCQSYRFAGGGMNMQKSYCGNALCGGCVGSPGHSGLVRITYA